ncbi:hypothetical protein AB2888_24755, partial [Escherichia coli]
MVVSERMKAVGGNKEKRERGGGGKKKEEEGNLREGNENKEERAALEMATGKMELVLARDDKPASAPV